MNARKLLVLGLLIIFAFASLPQSIAAADEQTPQEIITTLKKAPPEQEYELEIMFANPMSSTQIQNWLVSTRSPKVSQLIYKWEEHMGRYFLAEGESTQNAIQNFSAQTALFLNDSITTQNELITKSNAQGSTSLKETLALQQSQHTLLQEFKDQQVANQYGMMISGVALQGIPKDLEAFLKRTKLKDAQFDLKPLPSKEALESSTSDLSKDSVTTQGGPYSDPWKFSPSKGFISYNASSRVFDSGFFWSDVSGFKPPYTNYEHDILIFKNKNSYLYPFLYYSSLPDWYRDDLTSDKESYFTIGTNKAKDIKVSKWYYVKIITLLGTNLSAGPGVGDIQPQLGSWANTIGEHAYCLLNGLATASCIFADQTFSIGNTDAADPNGIMYFDENGASYVDFPFDRKKTITYWWNKNLNPDTLLKCPKGQFKGEYFSGKNSDENHRLTIRCDSKINFDWKKDSFIPGYDIVKDNFNVKWTGKINLTAGSYTFIAQADDYVRVTVGGNMISNGWVKELRKTISLKSGDHDIKVEYREFGGEAKVQFRWEKNKPTPTRTPTKKVPTKTFTRTPTKSPTKTHTLTITPSLTPTNQPLLSATPTITPSLTSLPITSTSTPTIPLPTTQTATSTISITPPHSQTLTPTVTPTPTGSLPSTITPILTKTATPTNTQTITPTMSIVPPTATETNTLTATITFTPTITKTITPTVLLPITQTPTPTGSQPSTITPTPTITATPTIPPPLIVQPSLAPAYSATCGNPPSYWWKNPNGLKGFSGTDFFLTMNANNSSQSGNVATFRPTISVLGQYKIEVYIPTHPVLPWPCTGVSIAGDTSKANYQIYHAAGINTVVVNQLPLNNQWANLGTFRLNTGTSGKVVLSDVTGETFSTRFVSVNVIRITWVGP